MGILVGLLSTCIQSLGLTLQRKSHILEDEKDETLSLRRPPYRRRRWQIGMLLFIISNIVGSSIQITTLPLPVLSTLQASGLVFNSLLATLILHESFTRYSLIGTLLVCVGAVLIATFGAIAEPAHSLDQLLSLLGERQFILWMVATFLLVIITIIITKAVRYLRPRGHHTPRARLARGMAYGAVSGILSAHSLLVAKSAVELLVRTIIDRNNQFRRWQSWMILLGLLALALSQLYYLHKGLKLCSTSVLYPFVFCIYNIVAILDGLIYFRQTSRLSVLHGCLIALGTVVLLAGVFALSWRLSSHEKDSEAGPLHRQPTITQSPLAPGLGFPEPASSTDTSRSVSPDDLPDDHDVESHRNGKLPYSSPFSYRSSPSHHHRRRSSTSGKVRYGYGAIAEDSAEIFSELQDEGNIPPTSPKLYSRPSSATITPSSHHRVQFSHHRQRPHNATFLENIEDEEADESSSLLPLNRSGTGRSYNTNRDRRRKSVTFSERNLGSGRQHRRRRSSRNQPQDAVGGWWKLRRWWSGGGGRGEKHRDGDREDHEDRREEGGDGGEV